MKRILFVVLALCLASSLFAAERNMVPRYNKLTGQWNSYPEVTIRDIQMVHPDSLAVADALQLTTPSRWEAQASPLMGDTVVVTATVVAPYFTITFTNAGHTYLLQDTSTIAGSEWSGVLVRVGDNDTTQAEADGFTNPERGDVIKMTCIVEEFPTLSMNSTTQLRPVPGISIDIVGAKAIASPPRVEIVDFYSGAYPGGTVNFTDGEQYEGVMVELVNLNINAHVSPGRGTWQMVDEFGNYLADYDASYYFTFGHGGSTPVTPDTSLTHFNFPPVGAVVDTIRGFINTVSGGENPRGYRICPLLPGDVKLGISLPTVNTHRRYPVTVNSFDTVRVQARVRLTEGGYNIKRAVLISSINNGPWEADTMSMITVDSIYEASILDFEGNPLPENTSVRYFIKGIDIAGNEKILANASTNFSGDTSKGFFFYTVLDRPYTIQDVQYTPYANGRSPYVGGVVAVSGIVTASSNDLSISPVTNSGTSAWYIQNGNAPWSGIWVVGLDSATQASLGVLQRGDSVTVTGTVDENFDMTRIIDSLVTVHASGRPVPAPVTLTSGTFGPGVGNGNPGAEPYEGMLIRIVNAAVSDTNPTFVEPKEYTIDDGSGPILVLRDGLNKYSNQRAEVVLGKTILTLNDDVDTLIGICHFSFSRYRIDPRQDDDFVVGTPYTYAKGWNIVSIGREQYADSTSYSKTRLFPGAISNAFEYAGGYTAVSTLELSTGYWVKFANITTIKQLGTKLQSANIPLEIGWNLIGAIGEPALTSAISVNPPATSLSAFYGFAGGYTVEDTLAPTKGYWVKSDSVATLTIDALSAAPKFNRSMVVASECNTLTITDEEGRRQVLYFIDDEKGSVDLRKYEMPPSSPEGTKFDARYTSGRSLETYPAVITEAREFPIMLKSSGKEVTLSWNIRNRNGKTFMLGDLHNGKYVKSTMLSDAGTMKVRNVSDAVLSLKVAGGTQTPREFALGQNYPNPFNPTTQFVVSMAEQARLEVAVYNILGQKVSTLVDEVRDAGYHTLTWNGLTNEGHAVASGVYFIRMQAAKFTGIRKIMMMK